MSKVGLWSTTAGNNNSAPPDGWPEGQAPSTVNDCARENMAALKTAMQDMDFFDHAFSPTYINANSFSVPGDQTARLNAGRQLKLFDASTHVRPIGSASFTVVTTISLGPGTALTSSLTSFAVSIINPSLNAVPNSGFRRNLVINGDMTSWQRAHDFSSSAGTNRIADNFNFSKNVSADIAIHHLSIATTATYAPSIGAAGTLFADSMQFAVISADAALAAGQLISLETYIEGYDWRHCAGNDMHLSFWVQTAQTGTYCVSLRNSGSSVSYVTNYTISSTGWNKINLAIPSAPLTPYTWDYSTGTGLAIRFSLGAGATFQVGAAGNWTAGNFLCTASQFNFASSAGHSIVFTGIQLEKGTAPTPFEELPAQQSFALCQRVLQVYNATQLPSLMGWNVTTTRSLFSMPLPVAMRASASVTFAGATGFRTLAVGGAVNTVSAITTNIIGLQSIRLDVEAQNATMVAGDATELLTNTGTIYVSSELI